MSTPRGSRAGRGARIAGAVVTVAALAALTGLVVGRSWQSTADGASDVSAERHGIALLQPLTELVAALTVAQSTAVRGGQIDGTTIRQTSHDVDAADAGYGAGLGTHERWTELHGRIDAVTGNPGTGADAYQRFGDVVGLAVTLLRQAGTAAGLTADPAPERAALADTLLAQVPDVLVYAGRAADLATLAGHPVPASSLAAVATARYQVATAAGRISDNLRPDDGSGGPGTVADLASQEDTLRAAVDGFGPSELFAVAADPVSAGTLSAAAQVVQAGAKALADAAWRQLDTLLSQRAAALGTQRRWDYATAAGLGLLALLLLWLLAPARRVADAEAEGAEPAADEPAEPIAASLDLIDARDLLMEELVHVGRGVRARTREGADHAE